MSNNLFLLAGSINFTLPLSRDLSAFAQALMSLNLWQCAVSLSLLREHPSPLSRCGSCILGKHPRQPHSPSSSPRAILPSQSPQLEVPPTLIILSWCAVRRAERPVRAGGGVSWQSKAACGMAVSGRRELGRVRCQTPGAVLPTLLCAWWQITSVLRVSGTYTWPACDEFPCPIVQIMQRQHPLSQLQPTLPIARPSSPSIDNSDDGGDAIRPDLDTVSFLIVLANLIVVELACVALRSDSRRNSQERDTSYYGILVPALSVFV
ncbi:hypothetical protein M405DRAFT_930442 [Rhizopogon salebrosus TDB-379]|nr:hypothetical protein M405DRAFT_930442 [Rhizopogon salebrosus TDB-379]